VLLSLLFEDDIGRKYLFKQKTTKNNVQFITAIKKKSTTQHQNKQKPTIKLKNSVRNKIKKKKREKKKTKKFIFLNKLQFL